MSSERIGQHLSVVQLPLVPGRKTKQWSVLSTRGDEVGQVQWYGPWRQFTFDPRPSSTFNRACLLDLARFLERVNREQRDKRSGVAGGEARVTLTCSRGCGRGSWITESFIDITPSGHTDVSCSCGGTMVAS
jgi:hypothetical protein